MEKKKRVKLIISILLFILGTIVCIFVSSYLHLLLTEGLDKIKLIELGEAVTIIKFNSKARHLFIAFESAIILISVFYFIINDNFYESELIEITPKIKIPKPAGQMQFGSARFINNKDIEKLFTISIIKDKDSLIKELLEFGNNEFQTIKKIKNLENNKNTVETRETSMNKEKAEQKVEIKDDELEKVYKYKIQEEIELLLKDDDNSLNYFNNMIQIIDEIICLEKERKSQIVKQKLDLMPKGDDKDKLIKKLEMFLNNNSMVIEEEIEKVEDEETKKHLNKLLNIFYRDFDKKQKEYIEKIESLLEQGKDITTEANLDKYMNMAKDIEEKINKLPNNQDKKKLFDKLFDFMDTIILESNKKYEEIEKMLW